MNDTTNPTAPDRHSLSTINPLIEHGKWSEDTADNIRNTLMFLADAIPAVALGEGFNKNTAHGVCMIIETCVAAMKVTK
jgi:hypothetical protein